MTADSPHDARRQHHQAHALGVAPTPSSPSAIAAARPYPTLATTLAVTGGKGGVGKTVLAVNLALLAQRSGFRTLLVDFDPGLGNVDVHLRMSPAFTLEDVGTGRCTVADALVRGPGSRSPGSRGSGEGKLDILLGRSGSTRMFRRRIFEKAHDEIETLRSRYDLILFDTGAGIGPNVLETMRRADSSLAVTTADPAAVTDAYALCKVAHGEGIPLPALVLNRARSRDDAFRTAGKLAAICEKFLGRRPDIAGFVREDSALERAVVDQSPIALAPPTTARPGPALEDLRALAASFLSRVGRAPRHATIDVSRASSPMQNAKRLLTATRRGTA